MVSRHHLIGWSRLEGATVVAIADPDLGKARARADDFAVPAAYGDAAAMLDDIRPDLLDIVAPVAVHGELIRLADARGIHASCQKPLAPSLAQAQAIVAGLAGSARLMVHENWRFRPHYRQIAGWLQCGVIGEPRAFRLETIGGGLVPPPGGGSPPALVRQPFFADLERLIVWETLVHHLDVLAFLLGPLVIRSASLDRLSPHVRGEDTALVQLEAGPTSGVIFASMAAAGRAKGDRLLILGTGGAIELDGARLSVDGRQGVEQIELDLEAAYQGSYDATIAHLARSLREGTPFETPPEVHLAILEAAEAIYASAARP